MNSKKNNFHPPFISFLAENWLPKSTHIMDVRGL